ncbi:unnamed protein product [Cuscuta campestris]|uniref:Nucleolus and neural progenitor protein-like N-terminal domain-containing protein n=1 Tax=Cuscuta campestris TaxID=132261 RepID=A0A484K0G0_9ASTE|nr:unnamed protein product [Cuscuta campestris]
MASEFETIEQRLKSFQGQLLSEFGILDRIVYKNKNQHRRCSYFQHLSKVRRDLRLLKSAKLDEILTSSFDIIHGKRPKQKLHLLESLKRRTTADGKKQTFLDRLLGVAHLLSQMVEPVLKAATQVSVLLAQSFFMGFSLTVLALLARIRVLVQQMLLDVVCVFNRVSSMSQKKQSVKLNTEGFEVFKEYYPAKGRAISLECVWETDKYKLIVQKGESQEDEMKQDEPIKSPKIKYQSIEMFLGDDEVSVDDGSSVLNKEDTNSPSKNLNDDVASSPGKSSVSHGSGSSFPLKHKSEAKRSVAFVPVKRPSLSSLPPSANEPVLSFQGMQNGDPSTRGEEEEEEEEEEDPFFSLLTGGNRNSTLF